MSVHQWSVLRKQREFYRMRHKCMAHERERLVTNVCRTLCIILFVH